MKMKKILAVGIILLFIGIAFAPSINVVLAKESMRNMYIDSVNESHRFSMNNPVTFTQQDTEEMKEMFNSINENMVNVNMRSPPLFILLIIFILKSLITMINLIKEGKFLSEMFKGFCFILLLVVGQVALIIVNFHHLLDFVWPGSPWTFENSIIGHIYLWLLNIVRPNNPYVTNIFHLFMKNKISTGIPMEGE
jgi:hypothetical protein